MFRAGSQTVLEQKPSLWGEVLIIQENRSAMLALRRVAQVLRSPTRRAPGPQPIFVHGPPGVGKTLLTQQLVREVVAGPKVLTAQMITASEWPRAEIEDDDDLLECDLLLIEDVHQLPERFHETLRKCLDHRIAHRKPTILSSTSGPAELPDFSRRLTSRFAAGLVLRINPPDIDSRRQLAEAFASRRRLKLNPETLDWLAVQSTGGIRSLQGLMERLRPLCKKEPLVITLQQAQNWLSEPEARRPSGMERIVSRVCLAFRVKSRDLVGTSRLRTIMVPRQVAMYLANKVAKMPLTRIGQHFGGRDHTTVLHAVRKVEANLKTDAKLAKVVKDLRSEVV